MRRACGVGASSSRHHHHRVHQWSRRHHHHPASRRCRHHNERLIIASRQTRAPRVARPRNRRGAMRSFAFSAAVVVSSSSSARDGRRPRARARGGVSSPRHRVSSERASERASDYAGASERAGEWLGADAEDFETPTCRDLCVDGVVDRADDAKAADGTHRGAAQQPEEAERACHLEEGRQRAARRSASGSSLLPSHQAHKGGVTPGDGRHHREASQGGITGR